MERPGQVFSPQRMKYNLYQSIRMPWSLIWRALLGMALASLTLIDLNTLSLDSRIQQAPKKELNPQIRLIRVSPFDTSKWQKGRNMLGSHSIFFEAADSYFWDESLWTELLSKALKSNPKKIGIALYLGNTKISNKNHELFANPKIIWASSKRAEADQLPFMTKYDRSNIGELNLSEDSDGKIRRYSPSSSDIGDFYLKLAGTPLSPSSHLKLSLEEKDLPMVEAHMILSEHPETLADLKDKILIFGRSLNESNLTFVTPLGAYSKLGISGVILTNFLDNSWIKIGKPVWYLLYFGALAVTIIWLISRYPHKVALILLIFLGLTLTLLSIYFFDERNIWLPITGVWVQITTTWVLFLGYSLNRMELSTIKLKEERRLHRELEELKINFVSLISHDLKTPIAKIQAVTSRLQHQLKSSELYEDIVKIEKYSKELNRYIKNVLKLLQVETSKFKLNLDSVDISVLIDEILLELGPLASEKNIQIVSDIPPLFPIDGDYQLIREVFLNLIQNAIQYSHIHSEIKIVVTDESDLVKIKIVDKGIGIAPGELPFLFDKFFRGKNSSISQQGSGLGLYLVKYFIELHEGRIHIESKPKLGTTVTVWLPVEQKSSNLDSNNQTIQEEHEP